MLIKHPGKKEKFLPELGLLVFPETSYRAQDRHPPHLSVGPSQMLSL